MLKPLTPYPEAKCFNMILAGFLACSGLKGLPIRKKIRTVAKEFFKLCIELTAAGTAPDLNGIPSYCP